ncbi:AfsR/SARP family transcriptional regulator [Micromonospora endolithica]|uniref:SARP family transcriptional regulator n=1 Tax=Micromonospora endolithica TaxID=230091 RepID=A0A3A9ZRD8_9ACTN|nr:BTAD domain-containing putative transcriptional regulator [Micromonospora endolithica]RKN50703.1 SARP family transcriptional regulator [Micromonospora endolithica]TWJ20561.1 DNA-binding SARP family transcriptional activator [Micromonospora endolithica]
MPLELRLLGPIELRHGPHVIVPGRRMHRLLLGLLAMRTDSMVPTSELVDSLWQDRPPRSARSMIHSRVSELRAALAAAGLGEDRLAIVTARDGYRAVLDPEAVDVHRFRRLLAGARGDGEPDWPHRRDLLQEAVGLWRGPAFGGWLPRSPAPPEVQALDEARLTALELWHEARLRSGTSGATLVDELAPLAARHPSRERLTLLLMRALADCGRSGEALHAYEQHRRWLATELGADPGPELRQLHVDLLRAAAPATAPTGTATGPTGTASGRTGPATGPAGSAPTSSAPAQLPAAPAGFVGRHGELDRLDRSADAGAKVVALVGPPGVGKTALALRWAHEQARRPGRSGHLHADLRGNDGAHPPTPAAVLERFLRALGVSGDAIPAEPEERAARYRSELARRSMVVVLDNAATSGQVRPLLPGAGDSLVVVTSRHRLDGLVATHGVARMQVEPLDEEEACALLARAGGDGRPVPTDPALLRRLAALCDRLPLALRIAAARLDADGGARALADRLTDENSRLGLLASEDVSVRAALAVSVGSLPAPARSLFRLLGRHPGQRPSTDAAAALADLPPARTRALLDQLAAAHLVHELDEDRYQLHDLVRLFAVERADAELPDHDPAPVRLLAWYRDAANVADRTLRPAERPNFDSGPPDPPVRFATPGAALAWLDQEADNLVAAVRAAAAEQPRLAWQIAAALYGWLFRRHHRDRWVELYTLAVRAARDAGDDSGEALIAGRLAIPLSLLGRHDEAGRWTRRAYELRHATGDRLGAATALLNLAAIENNAGRPEEAIRRLTEAEEHSRTLPDATHLRALVRSNLGEAHLLAGRHREAEVHYTAALGIAENGCGPRDVAEILVGLARTHRGAGDPAGALPYAVRAVEQARAAGDVLVEAEAREQLGRARVERGDRAGGLHELRTALAAYRQKGHRGTADLARDVAALADHRR